ncbi:DUF4142 domain-containing protein [Derxia gummosa]|uniref:DUF4142 domain-containing protein n=1 Tax=Derxia gummosa DSM 723 TaxID=1121388 RepID=A0A8B6X9E6_9BURK|nr:DUF4142 domain-containing protein [Derxia gummosa]
MPATSSTHPAGTGIDGARRADGRGDHAARAARADGPRLTLAGLALMVAIGVTLPGTARPQGMGGETRPGNAPTTQQTPATPTAPTAQPSATSTRESTAKLSRADRKFIEEAAAGGLAEVQLGGIAVKNAGHDSVRQFGQRMVDDHGKANTELKTLASAKGVQLPTETSGKMQREAKKLQGLSGNKFDREYMDSMTDDHEKDIKLFRKAADGADDADVKAFAAKTLPILEEHHRMAEETERMVKK